METILYIFLYISDSDLVCFCVGHHLFFCGSDLFSTTQACALGIQETGDRCSLVKVPYTYCYQPWYTHPEQKWVQHLNRRVKAICMQNSLSWWEPYHLWWRSVSLWQQIWLGKSSACFELVRIKQRQNIWQFLFKYIIVLLYYIFSLLSFLPHYILQQ